MITATCQLLDYPHVPIWSAEVPNLPKITAECKGAYLDMNLVFPNPAGIK